MRDGNGFDVVRELRAAGMVGLAAAWVAATMVAATPLHAQSAGTSAPIGVEQRTGVSRPAQVVITDAPDADTTDTGAAGSSGAGTGGAKPSADVPMTATTPAVVYGPYVPYRGAGSAAAEAPSASAGAAGFDPDAAIVTEATAGRDERQLLAGAGNKATADAGIVTYVPSAPGEIPDGTLVRVKLREELSTLTTRPGTKFTAEVSEPVMRDGRVIVPVGSVMEGRVTWVRGGKRIGGAAAIHLEPWTVTLPDGSEYVLRARAIDTSSWDNTGVDSEGTITLRESRKRVAGVMGLTAAGGMAAGAMIAGVPGALIGAGVGAGVSTVVWLRQDRQAVLPKDLGVVFSLTEPMSVTPVNAGVGVAKVGAGGE
jgi:hypothetical protein